MSEQLLTWVVQGDFALELFFSSSFFNLTVANHSLSSTGEPALLTVSPLVPGTSTGCHAQHMQISHGKEHRFKKIAFERIKSGLETMVNVIM